MARRKLAEPFGLITQREWNGLIARGADLTHVGMFTLLRVRADRDGVTRDTLPSLGRWMNRSDDTASSLLAWLKTAGVISSERKSIKGGQRGLSFVTERRALPFDEWMSTESVRGASDAMTTEGVRCSSTMSTEDPPDDHREMEGRAPRTAPCIPDVLPEKPQTEAGASPSGVREGSDEEWARVDRCWDILAESQHAESFAGRSADLLALTKKFPGRDIEQACRDLVEKVDLIEYDSKAVDILEGFVRKARRVRPTEREFTPDEVREHYRRQLEAL